MSKEEKFIRAKYDPITMKVTGFYPSDINYLNNVIDDEKMTIDCQSFIKISEEQHREILGKQMIVTDSGLVEYIEKETIDQKKIRIKSQLIASRKAFLETSLKEAMEYIVNGQEYPHKSKRELAKKEIQEIESSDTISALNQFNPTFE